MGIKSRIEDVNKEDTNRSKQLVFGLVYGGREGGLSQSTGLPKGEVRKFINKWFELYPETEIWMDARRKDVKGKGCVTSFLGRRRRFYGLDFVKDKVVRKSEREAINSPIQGLVSDLCCGAAVRIDKRIKGNEFKAGLIMTTHDELFYEVPDAELAKLKEIVEEEMTAYIPEIGMGIPVDIEVGSCWSENEELSSLDLVQLTA
ncbi:DNA polymerase I [subsurface metagenome]